MWPIKPKVFTIWPLQKKCVPTFALHKQKLCSHKTCTLTFIFPLFPLLQTGNHPNVFPLGNGLTNCMWYINNNEILLSNKKE